MTGKRRDTGNAKLVASFSAVVAALGTIHTFILLPLVRSDTLEIIQHAIERHANTPHPGAISRHEFNLVLRELELIQDQIKGLRSEVRAR